MVVKMSHPLAQEIICDLPHLGVFKKIYLSTIHLEGYSLGDTIIVEGKQAIISSLCKKTENDEMCFVEDFPTTTMRKILKSETNKPECEYSSICKF